MNFSIDTSVWIFIIFFLIIFTVKTIDAKAIDNNYLEEKKVFFISEMLVSTHGIPSNWDVWNVEQVGLLEKYNGYYKKCYINIGKIDQLMQMDYDKLTELLDVENIKITVGEKTVGHSKDKAKIRRYCNCKRNCK